MRQQLIDQNFNRHACLIPSLTEGMQVHHEQHLSWVDSGLSCDTFNIIHITDGQAGVEAEIEDVIAYFRTHKRDHCVWVSESNLSLRVRNTLRELGLGVQGEELGMQLDLEQTIFSGRPPAYLQLVDSPALLEEYAQLIAKNWTPPDHHVPDYYRMAADHYLDPAHRIQLLLYLENGQAVSCAEMFPSDHETLGLYGFATLASHRGRGIGSLVFQAALRMAKSAGYRQVVLQATEDGIGIYRRYGFEEVERYLEFG